MGARLPFIVILTSILSFVVILTNVSPFVLVLSVLPFTVILRSVSCDEGSRLDASFTSHLAGAFRRVLLALEKPPPFAVSILCVLCKGKGSS